jgi:hypothetical protein
MIVAIFIKIVGTKAVQLYVGKDKYSVRGRMHY